MTEEDEKLTAIHRRRVKGERQREQVVIMPLAKADGSEAAVIT